MVLITKEGAISLFSCKAHFIREFKRTFRHTDIFLYGLSIIANINYLLIILRFRTVESSGTVLTLSGENEEEILKIVLESGKLMILINHGLYQKVKIELQS